MTAERRRSRFGRTTAAAGRRLDLDLAVRCVELSKLAYAPPDKGQVLASQFGYQSFDWLARRDERDYLFVVSDPDRVYVVFRGTDDVLDWITNLTLWKTVTAMGRVHSGYYSVCEALLPELTAVLERLPDKPVVFTGHSMGGALAVLSAASLHADGKALDSIYTFGQPRIGGPTFSEHVKRSLPVPFFRFVNGADAIAAWGLGSGALAGTACYFDVRGALVFGHRLSQVPRLSLRHHRLEHYRYFLRLNQLKVRALREDDDATLIQG